MTTNSMTADSVSKRSAQATSSAPESIQVNSSIVRGCAGERDVDEDDDAEQPPTGPCAAGDDLRRAVADAACAPNRPAMTAPSSGRKTMAAYIRRSALHQVDVLDRDRAAVAEIDDEDGKADRRLGRGDGQHEHARRPGRPGRRGSAENATRLMLTASSISSIDIRMTMTFLRLRKMPKMPSVNRIAATVR